MITLRFVEPWLHVLSNGKWQDYDQLVILANRPVLMCYMVLTDILSGPFLSGQDNYDQLVKITEVSLKLLCVETSCHRVFLYHLI